MTQPDQISAAQLSEILKRASELDAERDTLTGSELARVAAEAGIHPSATAAAMEEVLTQRVPRVTPVLDASLESRSSQLRKTMAFGVGAGALAGALFAFVPGFEFAAVAGAGVSVLFGAAREMFRKGHRRFQLQNLATWIGFSGAASIGLAGYQMEGAAAIGGSAAVISAAVGFLLVWLGSRGDPESD